MESTTKMIKVMMTVRMMDMRRMEVSLWERLRRSRMAVGMMDKLLKGRWVIQVIKMANRSVIQMANLRTENNHFQAIK
jgi:hypothetical protein